MAKPTSKSKSRAPKRRSEATARVLATVRPPVEPAAIEDVSATQPYVTDVWLTNELGVSELSASGQEVREQWAALGERLLTLPPSQARDLFQVILFSNECERLHCGVYATTAHNPIFAIQAFVAFHALGLFPPHWVLNWLNDAFASYLQANGDTPLETLLG